MRQFSIPSYVKRMLERASFAIETSKFQDGYDPSYTIIIPKHSIYAQADTLKAEVEKLVAWATRKVYGILPPAGYKKCLPVVVRSLPTDTHYCKQYAVIDIYDPIMVSIEHLIGKHAISLS